MVPLVNSAKFNNDSVDVSSKITDRFILYPVLTDKQTNKQTNIRYLCKLQQTAHEQSR